MADPLTRRSFLARASGVALAGLALASGLGRERASAHVSPPPCRTRCEPISRTGCACGGNLYRCTGCGRSVHVCATRDRFAPFCLRRAC